MTLAGQTFRAIAKSKNGTAETRVKFHLDDGVVTASYGGGSIGVGQVVGRRTGDLLYQCLTVAGEIARGRGIGAVHGGSDCSSSGNGSPGTGRVARANGCARSDSR